MAGRSFYGALVVKIMDRLVRETGFNGGQILLRSTVCQDNGQVSSGDQDSMVGRSFYGALDVKIMDRLVRETRIQWWADFSTEHWMSR